MAGRLAPERIDAREHVPVVAERLDQLTGQRDQREDLLRAARPLPPHSADTAAETAGPRLRSVPGCGGRGRSRRGGCMRGAVAGKTVGNQQPGGRRDFRSLGKEAPPRFRHGLGVARIELVEVLRISHILVIERPVAHYFCSRGPVRTARPPTRPGPTDALQPTSDVRSPQSYRKQPLLESPARSARGGRSR